MKLHYLQERKFKFNFPKPIKIGFFDKDLVTEQGELDSIIISVYMKPSEIPTDEQVEQIRQWAADEYRERSSES